MHTSRNMAHSDNIIRDGLRELRRRLPQGWSVSEALLSTGAKVDAMAEIRAPDRRSVRLAIEARSRLDPRAVAAIAETLRLGNSSAVPVVMSRFLTASVREQLEKEAVGFVDLTGNMRLALPNPGLFIEVQGASEDPDREERPARSLRGPKAGRLVRALVDFRRAPGVRELASTAKVDPGYVSRVLAFLDSEALIERRQPSSATDRAPRDPERSWSVPRPTRTHAGPIVRVDWPALLRRWALDAPLDARGTLRTYLEPRGISPLLARLAVTIERYAVTGSNAAARIAPIAPSRLATIWVDDANEAASRLGLRETDAGANIILVEPTDSAVFERTQNHGGVVYAAPSQVVADLLTSPGRGPAEAEELIAWMTANEEAWRG